MTCAHGFCGEAYFTDFESFAVGDNMIANVDQWIGSHPGQQLDGVMDEALHGVVGIGNAAFLGGNPTDSLTSTNRSVYLRRPVNLDPVGADEEIATFSVIFGIKDSSDASLIPGSEPPRLKRDDFEFLVYNNDAAPALLAGVQFDNTTLDSLTGNPLRLIYRLNRNATTGLFEFVATGYHFLPGTLEELRFRINYRTNLWSAFLSGVPIFQDVPFYSGAASKTLGSVMVKMAVANTNSVTNTILPGDNYLLFDDYLVRTDPLVISLAITKPADSAARLTWNEEAGYSYQVDATADFESWTTNLADSAHTATTTALASLTDPTTPIPMAHFYRVKRTYPLK